MVKQRRGLGERIGARLEAGVRQATTLFDVLASEPRKFPALLMHGIRSALHTLWQSKGGGFYGLGVAGAFVYPELRTIAMEVADSEGAAQFFIFQMFEFVVRFSFMSLVNGALAVIWPVLAIRRIGVWPVVVLVCVGYWMFKRWEQRRERKEGD